VKSGENLWQLINQSQIPSNIGGTFDTNRNGKYPTNVWEYVCSKVTGGLPKMLETTSNNETLSDPINENNNNVNAQHIDNKDNDNEVKEKHTTDNDKNEHVSRTPIANFSMNLVNEVKNTFEKLLFNPKSMLGIENNDNDNNKNDINNAVQTDNTTDINVNKTTNTTEHNDSTEATLSNKIMPPSSSQ